MIASGFHKCNSQRHIHLRIADGYYLNMRGIEKIRNRAARLRLLNKEYTFEEMAKRLGGNANPRYLSQIANEYLGKGRKTPRSLSDNYASRLEECFGLKEGWFDLPLDEEAGQDAEHATPGRTPNTEPGAAEGVETGSIDELINLATPRSRETLQRIRQRILDGSLDDDDLAVLSAMADRLAEKKQKK